MKRRKEVGRLDIENPKCKWHKTVYLEDGKLMKTIHDGSFTPVEPEPEMLPLYFEGRQINSHVGVVSTLETAPNLEWCWDNKNWKPWPYTTIDGEHRFDPLLLSAVGDRIYVRGDNPDGLAFIPEGEQAPNFTNFVIDGSVSAGGNIMSLLDKTMELTEVPDYGFTNLFAIMGEDVEPVLLTPPSMDTITAIVGHGCESMYAHNTLLTHAADMPLLTNIGERGCGNMYGDCTFDISDDGSTLNFAFPTPPVTAGETTYATAYEIAQWMGNTNGFSNSGGGGGEK